MFYFFIKLSEGNMASGYNFRKPQVARSDFVSKFEIPYVKINKTNNPN